MHYTLVYCVKHENHRTKSTHDSIRISWNLMNKFRSFQFLSVSWKIIENYFVYWKGKWNSCLHFLPRIQLRLDEWHVTRDKHLYLCDTLCELMFELLLLLFRLTAAFQKGKYISKFQNKCIQLGIKEEHG